MTQDITEQQVYHLEHICDDGSGAQDDSQEFNSNQEEAVDGTYQE
jgi:hypothetical protein